MPDSDQLRDVETLLGSMRDATMSTRVDDARAVVRALPHKYGILDTDTVWSWPDAHPNPDARVVTNSCFSGSVASRPASALDEKAAEP